MLEFTPITLNDFPKLRSFYEQNPSRICDSTPISTFIWRDMYNVRYAIEGSSLYMKVSVEGLGETFPLPLGGDSREQQLCAIADYCCRNRHPINFYPVPEDELPAIQAFFPNSACICDRDTFDYLYRAEDLKYFKGKKFSGQRNHVNKFLKTYESWEFRVITTDDVPALHDFLDEYVSRVCKPAPSFHEDIAKTREVLDHYELYSPLGGMLLADGQIVGFALGEVLGDTLYTHIEKADRSIPGGYQMLVSQYAQHYAVGPVEFINREDDTGDEGLRMSKLAYQPVALLEKYTITVEEPCTCCQKFPKQE